MVGEKELVNDVVVGYLKACDSALTQARGDAMAADGASKSDAIARAREAWLLLRDARVFSVHPDKYHRTISVINDTLAEMINRKPSEVMKIRDFAHVEAPRVPFPDRLPFPATFIGFGTQTRPINGEMRANTAAGALASAIARFSTEGTLEELGIREIGLIGYVIGMVGDRQRAFALVLCKGPSVIEPGGVVFVHPVFDEQGWFQSQSYDPWALNVMVTYVNSHRTYVTERVASGNNRLDRNRISKKLKFQLKLPEPFYVVHVEDKTVDRVTKRLVAHHTIEWTHRWDVRGHEVIRIVKGKKPVPTKERDSLLERGYKIHESIDASHPDWQDLDHRKVRLAKDEWVAILRTWRKAHVKGPTDRPYVPSLRVPTKDLVR